MAPSNCFKAYDIRGRIDDDLTPDLAYRLGMATALELNAKSLVVGRDARGSSHGLLEALAKGAQDVGTDVKDLGLCGTEEVYFGTEHTGACGGVMVTASHNPIEYNGFKIVGARSTPLADKTFRAIEEATLNPIKPTPVSPGRRTEFDCRDFYIDRLLSFVNPSKIAPLHIVVNAGNGAAGPTFDAILSALVKEGAKIKVTRVHHEPDDRFPNGIPNPLLPENHAATADVVRRFGADFGIAWDGDFDRCFFFDHNGEFVPGEYVVAILSEAILAEAKGAKIVHDPRVMWNTQRIVRAAGGDAVPSKTGHALVKAKMREADAVYGGEMSAHHYFRDFMYCDSGMIPWLLVLENLSKSGSSLKDVVDDMRARHPSSGEINFRVADAQAATQTVLAQFKDEALSIDWLDGLSVAFEKWRFNLRSSNTEPLLRLNVETLDDAELATQQVRRITDMLKPCAVAA